MLGYIVCVCLAALLALWLVIEHVIIARFDRLINERTGPLFRDMLTAQRQLSGVQSEVTRLWSRLGTENGYGGIVGRREFVDEASRLMTCVNKAQKRADAAAIALDAFAAHLGLVLTVEQERPAQLVVKRAQKAKRGAR